MAKKTVAADKKASSKPKSSKKAKQADTIVTSAIEATARVNEDLIRERAYGLWIEEGRPHGRDLAHWRRAHQELQREAT